VVRLNERSKLLVDLLGDDLLHIGHKLVPLVSLHRLGEVGFVGYNNS
jgi:hypothetical protein